MFPFWAAGGWFDQQLMLARGNFFASLRVRAHRPRLTCLGGGKGGWGEGMGWDGVVGGGRGWEGMGT